MTLRINDTDSIAVQRLKLLYIIPFLFLIIIPATLWYGVKEMIKQIPDIAREIYNISQGH